MSKFPAHPSCLPRQRGFTLVEMIVVMVVTGVLAGIMVLFIRQPVKNYTDAVGRAEMTDIADLALRRMARELRTALPNSARLSVVNGAWLLEFIPTKAGGKYLAVGDSTNGNPLSFTSSNATTFDVVGPMPASPYPITGSDAATVNPDYIVIYNLGPGFTNADAYVGGNRARVQAVAGNTITMAAPNPFVAGGDSMGSPDHRFQVANKPVTFRCASSAAGTGTLTRYWGYDFRASQPDPTTLTDVNLKSALMADHVLGCDFSISQAASQPAALIGLSIALARANSGGGLETVTLTDQIHVDSTP